MVAVEEKFSVTKSRIEKALDQLRSDLADMREQDLTILRQFMCIQQTVHMLCRDNVLEKKTYDSSILQSPDPHQKSPPRMERTIHMPLCRVQSAPLQCRRDDSDDIPFMSSFDSFVGQPLPCSIDEDCEQDCNLTSSRIEIEVDKDSEFQEDTMTSPIKISIHIEESDSDDEDCYREEQQPQSLDLHNHKENLNHQISLGTKMAPAYSSHYKNILRKSSQIWREIKRSQDDEGHVDARKMAALQLFL